MKTVVIPLGAQREDVDERMMPDGLMRRVQNARFRRDGALEACPGPIRGDALEMVDGSGTNQMVAIATNDMDFVLAMAGGYLVSNKNASAPNVLYEHGDVSQLCAPYSTTIATGRVVPWGCSYYDGRVYVVYSTVDRTTGTYDRLWYSVCDATDGLRILYSAEIKPLGVNVLDHESVTIYDTYVRVNYTVIGGRRIDMSTNTASSTGLAAIGVNYYLVSPNTGTWCHVYTPDASLGTIVAQTLAAGTVTLTSGAFATNGRILMHACIGYVDGGIECVYVAYRAAGGTHEIAAYRLDTLAQVGPTIADGSSGSLYRSIAPLTGSRAGVMVWQTNSAGPSATSSRTDVFAVTSDPGPTWTFVDALRQLEYPPSTGVSSGAPVGETHWDYMDTIADWTQEGDTLMIPLCDWRQRIYNAGYVLSARLVEPSGGDPYVAARIEARFAYGRIHHEYAGGAFPSIYEHPWTHSPCAVGDDGELYVVAGLLEPRWDSSAHPAELRLYRWRKGVTHGDLEGYCVQAEVGGLTLLAGGYLAAFDGERSMDVGFGFGVPQFDVITIVGSGGFQGTFQYVVLWEWVDAHGNRHLSSPSKIYEITIGTSDHVDIKITRRSLPSSMRNVTAFVFRTEDGGSTFYNITALGIKIDENSSVTISDSASDSSIINNPILYTQGESGALGGQLPYYPPPACRSIAVSPTRVALAGLEQHNIVEFSHEFFPGEPPSFSDSDALRIWFADEVIAVAWGGSQWLVFSKTRVWSVTGNGPDVSGNGEWNRPYQLQSPTGVHQPLGVARTSIGVVFQGSDGRLYVIPDGGAAAQDITGPIWRTMVRAARVDNDWVVSIAELCRSGVNTIMVHTRAFRWALDTRRNVWSEETAASPCRATIVDNEIRWLGTDGSNCYVYSEGDPVATQPITLEFGRIFPFGHDGYGKLRSVTLTLSSSNNGFVTLSDSDDGTSAELHGVVGTDWYAGDEDQWQRYEWRPPRQRRESMMLDLTTSEGGEWRFHTLALEVERLPGNKRRGPGQGVLVHPYAHPWGYEFSEVFGP